MKQRRSRDDTYEVAGARVVHFVEYYVKDRGERVVHYPELFFEVRGG